MNYEEFKQYVAAHITEFLSQDERYEVTIQSQKKNNNISYDVLAVKGNSNVIPVIYLEPFYYNYQKGIDAETILEQMAAFYRDEAKQIGSFSKEKFQYANVEKDIFVTVVNAEKNRELLDDVPHELVEDLALLYRIHLELSDRETGSMLIHNSHMEMWGIDENTLKEAAWSNMHKRFQPVFSSIGDVLKGFGFYGMPEVAEQMELYVLTNKEHTHGAAYMFDREVMGRIADRLGTDLVVIPSSIHETLLLRKHSEMDYEALQEIVREVNRTQLQTIEILSDSVYQYSRENQTLSRVQDNSPKEIMMPDKVSMQEMYRYGYTWDGMLPLTKEKALELKDTELQIYKLYADGAEGMLETTDEIYAHDGLFGVKKESWFAYQNSIRQEQIEEITQKM